MKDLWCSKLAADMRVVLVNHDDFQNEKNTIELESTIQVERQ